jgi:hypothetical protein
VAYNRSRSKKDEISLKKLDEFRKRLDELREWRRELWLKERDEKEGIVWLADPDTEDDEWDSVTPGAEDGDDEPFAIVIYSSEPKGLAIDDSMTPTDDVDNSESGTSNARVSATKPGAEKAIADTKTATDNIESTEIDTKNPHRSAIKSEAKKPVKPSHEKLTLRTKGSAGNIMRQRNSQFNSLRGSNSGTNAKSIADLQAMFKPQALSGSEASKRVQPTEDGES